MDVSSTHLSLPDRGHTSMSAHHSNAAADRRTVLKGAGLAAAATAATAFTPIGTLSGAEAAAILGVSAPSLPGGAKPYVKAFKNWAEDIVVDDLWTVDAQSPQHVVDLTNWAQENGWRLRAKGHMHTWCPITVAPGESKNTKVLLVNTREKLKDIKVKAGRTPSVTVGAGADMEHLLSVLAQHGYGIVHHPAPGDITVGGVLAIGGHGTAVPAKGEKRAPGQSFGSMSNLVLSMTAVVWDESAKKYALRTFQRNEKGIGPLLTHLGRSFVTEVTLQVGPEQKMRCESFLDISTEELLAPKGSRGKTVESLLDSAGRVELILFPGTQSPWTKVWSVAPRKPIFSRKVSKPFNYTFSDNVPKKIVDLARDISLGAETLTPAIGGAQFGIVATGLIATSTWDIWSSAKNLLLYVKPDTLRVTANGYAVLCARDNVQKVLNDFHKKFKRMLGEYEFRDSYPMNGPLEIRVVGLDDPSEVEMDGAEAAWLSPTRPAPDHPEWDCAVYFDVLTLPGTRNSEAFYRELEQWMYSHYKGDYARVRVEWSKGWAYSTTKAWGDNTVMTQVVPKSLSDGQPAGKRFSDAATLLDRYDPHRIFAAPFHDRLLPPTNGAPHVPAQAKPQAKPTPKPTAKPTAKPANPAPKPRPQPKPQSWTNWLFSWF